MLKQEALDRFEKRLRQVFKPHDNSDIVEFLQNEIKAIPFSPMPSGFKADLTPWMKEPLRAMADDKIRLVMTIAPIQSGKSLNIEMFSCHILARAPSPTMFLLDQDPHAEQWMASRLKVLWGNCPKAKERVGSKVINSKTMEFDMDGATFWCSGAFNKKNLQGKSVRWLVGDETWLWPKGHIQEALARVESFGWLGKACLSSQGSWEGDETHELWKTTTQNEWGFQCPHCNYKQIWNYSQIRIPENAKLPNGEWDFQLINKGILYKCEGCDHHFPDTRKSRMEMNDRGLYISQCPTAAPEKQGFRWNALCARHWGKIVEQKLRADLLVETTGDTTNLEIWTQKQMAQFWSAKPDSVELSQIMGEFRQGDEWDGELGIDLATKRLVLDKKAPNTIPCRFMTVDVQRNGFYCVVRMWGAEQQSRLYRWKFLQTWEDVRAFERACGVYPALVFVDCGDQYEDVIRQCGIYKWTALRGDRRNDFIWRVQTPQGLRSVAKTYAPARLVNAGGGVVRVHHFSNLALKDQLSRLRKIGKHSIPIDVTQEYVLQLESEVRVLQTNGQPIWKPVTQKRANHLFDCEVMQLVPAMAFGILAVQARTVSEEEAKKVESDLKESSKAEPDEA